MIKVINYITDQKTAGISGKHVLYRTHEYSYQEIRWDNHFEFSDGHTLFMNPYYTCSFEDKKPSKPKAIWTIFKQFFLGLK